MKRRASAHWTGPITAGKGTITSESGVLRDSPYSFTTRFQQEKGTNPEELIAAAHASCFTMAVSAALSKEGYTDITLDTEAVVGLEKQGDGWSVTSSELSLDAKVPGLDNERFQVLVEDAKANCPISKLLKVPITLRAAMDSSTPARAVEPTSVL